jgi:Raf kinase inhibitor-like YbhB/YbcL family protein
MCSMIFLILFFYTWLQQPTLVITSPDFEHEGDLPSRFTCDGDSGNPTFTIQGIPERAKSLALIMEDPDVPTTTFNHWIVWNIEPTNTIAENSVPGIEGMNSLGKTTYLGPCPVEGTHRYFFKIYALDEMLELEPDANKYKLETAMNGHVLAKGEIVGLYRKR